jgi:hypothetical protein
MIRDSFLATLGSDAQRFGESRIPLRDETLVGTFELLRSFTVWIGSTPPAGR